MARAKGVKIGEVGKTERTVKRELIERRPEGVKDQTLPDVEEGDMHKCCKEGKRLERSSSSRLEKFRQKLKI